MTITSSDNQWIKELRRLATSHGRGKSSLFAAEGEDLVSAALSAGWVAKAVLVREGSELGGDEVEAELLDSVSTLGSGTRMIGIFERTFAASPTAGLIVHLCGVKDPGNVGTIIRSAHALGASCVSLGPDSGDPFSGKAVRASMGSVFAVPVLEDWPVGDLPGLLVGLTGKGEVGPIPDGDLTLVVGSERDGLPAEVLAACDLLWAIPMAPGAESLNASVAASVALYAANRMLG